MYEDIEYLAQQWIQLDQNTETRSDIQHLLAEGDFEELERRLRTRIDFGTAGLRGKMEAGWSRMNDLIIIQAAQGLCAYVIQNIQDARSRGAVIGHDHRHNSEKWAKLTAAAFISMDVKVYLHRGPILTPLVPFSVNALNAACGVMITASHNPKQDNGFKVYWENAVQIIEPHDKGISDSIKANLTPKVWSIEHVASSALCYDCTADMTESYLASLRFLAQEIRHAPSVKFVNTSMHGVSDIFLRKAFDNLALPSYIPVREQQYPDPNFPTVPFPNPEERGALDLAISTADSEGASYVIAQDPDSDRFAAAEKQPDGTWIQFTGDQLGVLFADMEICRYKETELPMKKLAMIASTVSSKMLESMAKREGFVFTECLTGFKYIGNTALDLVRQGFNVPFGYEEAIGFMFGPKIRDKDGIAASIAFVQLVLSLQAGSTSVFSHLQSLYKRYGYFRTRNGYFICNEPRIIDSIFAYIRNKGEGYPSHIGGCKITAVHDLTTGYDSRNQPTCKSHLPMSAGHMIQFRASSQNANIVLTIRTSGTEPKIKYYLEGSGRSSDEVWEELTLVLSELTHKWFQADVHHLERRGD